MPQQTTLHQALSSNTIQTSNIMFSCPSGTSSFSFSDFFDDTDALLAFRGGLVATSFFSGELSLMLRDLRADLVRFLPCRFAGLDDSRPVPVIVSVDTDIGVSTAVIRGAGGATVGSRIVLKKSRAAANTLLSTLTLFTCLGGAAQLTVSWRGALFSESYDCRRCGWCVGVAGAVIVYDVAVGVFGGASWPGVAAGMHADVRVTRFGTFTIEVEDVSSERRMHGRTRHRSTLIWNEAVLACYSLEWTWWRWHARRLVDNLLLWRLLAECIDDRVELIGNDADVVQVSLAALAYSIGMGTWIRWNPVTGIQQRSCGV